MERADPDPDRLVVRWRAARDPQALAALFDLVAPDLHRLALHLTPDAAAADDLLQETFLATLALLDRHDPARPVVPWLAGILRMKAHEARRAAARRPDPRRVAPPANPLDPALAAAGAEERERIRAAIDALPEPYRRPALLAWRHGLTPAEIAEVEGRPPGTIRSILSRARDRLKALLGLTTACLLSGTLRPAPGLAAVRARVLAAATARAASLGGAAAVPATLFGILAMKKLVLAAAALALLATGFALWPDAPGRPPAEPAGRASAPDDVRPPASGVAEGAPVAGAAAPATAAIPGPMLAGRVLDAAGDPVAGAEVLVAPNAAAEPLSPGEVSAEFRTFAGPDGRFAIATGTRAAVVVIARAEGFAPAVETGVPDGEDVVLVLTEGIVVFGVVRSPEGRPVAGAGVEIHRLSGRVRVDRTATTDDDGRFRVSGLPAVRRPTGAEDPEVLAAFATAPGYGPATASRRLVWTGRATGEATIDLTFVPEEVLEGRVVRGEDGSPLPGARITVVHTPVDTSNYGRRFGRPVQSPFRERTVGEAVSGPDGRFRIVGLPTHAVIHAAAAGRAATPPQHFGPRERQRLAEEGAEFLFRLWPATLVAGRVLDEEGRPIAGVHVYASPVPELESEEQRLGFGESGPDGRYSFEVAMTAAGADAYLNGLSSTPPLRGRNEDPLRIRLSPGRTEAPDLVLRPLAGALRLTVRNPAGEAVPGAVIHYGRMQFQTLEADDLGVAMIPLWGRGIDVRVEAPGFATARFSVETEPAGVVVERTVVLSPGRTLTGRVLDAAGAPVAGATVGTTWGFADLRIAGTDEAGRFRLEDLPAGPWTVTASVPRANPLLPPLATRVEDVEGPEVELRLPPDDGPPLVPLSLVVVASDGRPIEGTQVELYRGGAAVAEFRSTDEDGRVDYAAIVPAGELLVRVRKSGWRTEDFLIRVQPRMAPVRIPLSRGIALTGRISAPDGRRVRGVVYAEYVEDGKRIAGQIEEDGSYRLEGLPPGPLRLLLWTDAVTHVADGGALFVAADEEREVEWSPPLAVGGTLTIRWPGETGARVRATDEGGRVVLLANVPDAAYDGRLYGVLVPGAYRVEYTPPGGEPILKTAEVVAGRGASVRFP